MGTRIRDGRSGATKQLPWREDASVLDAMDAVVKLHSEGVSMPQVAKRLGIPVSTCYDHWNRGLELRKERVTEAVNDHIAEMYAFLGRLYAELDQAESRSLNKGQILGQIRQTYMDIAKLDGSMIDRKEVKGDLTLLDLLSQVGETTPEGA